MTDKDIDQIFIRLRVLEGIREGKSCDTCGRGSDCTVASVEGRGERRVWAEAGVNCWRPPGTVIVFDERPA